MESINLVMCQRVRKYATPHKTKIFLQNGKNIFYYIEEKSLKYEFFGLDLMLRSDL